MGNRGVGRRDVDSAWSRAQWMAGAPCRGVFERRLCCCRRALRGIPRIAARNRAIPVSGYPIMLDGSKVTALVVGGGAVALRKIRALLDGGVHVAVIAPEVNSELRLLAEREPRLTVTRGAYSDGQIAAATLVTAATDDAAVNARVAGDATRQHRLVNVVDAPGIGTFLTPAVHRAGALTIAIFTGRLPAAAAAIRD